ncbi:hypothetical protein TNCV_883921 [Trichonephila clavipes]|nr:hypothetical protein TNCV_883921 [Trichonephila clavipes]
MHFSQVSLKTSRVEGLMRVKSVETQSLSVGELWKFGVRCQLLCHSRCLTMVQITELIANSSRVALHSATLIYTHSPWRSNCQSIIALREIYYGLTNHMMTRKLIFRWLQLTVDQNELGLEEEQK